MGDLLTHVAPVAGAQPTEAAPLSMLLYRERGGAVIAEEPVLARDLVDALGEFWFENYLRRGARETALADLSASVRAIFREDAEIGRYCSGFELECERGGTPVARYFDRGCLSHIAERRARALIAEGQITTGDHYYYALAAGSEGANGLVRGPAGRGAPHFASARLAPLLARADAVQIEADDRDYPVFFTREAHARAERISRRGENVQPPVETGGLLIGFQADCPDSGDVFSLIVDVLEAAQSQATTYSLTYSGATWARIQTVLRARQSQPETRHHRIMGQAHGHNFSPPGGPPCEACDLLPFCTRTSASLSEDDRTWARATFSAEPWAVSQVFGLDAQNRPVETFYGQRGGRLARRGYYLIDHFDEREL